MTPKEKAIELIVKYGFVKQCVLICVDEILNTGEYLSSYNNINGMDPFEYWEQVKQEIGKL